MTHRRGFTLVELSIALVVSGLMIGFIVQANQTSNNAECYANTKTQLMTIRGAIEQFARKNDRLPLPAARTIGVEDINYGREAAPAAIDQNNGVSFGALPFQALGLPATYGGDCFGNKYTYMVTTALTTSASSGGYLDSTVLGNMALKNAGGVNVNTTTAYAVVSHGADKLGAVKINYSGAAKGWCTGTDLRHINCTANSASVADAAFNDGASSNTNYFDDVVVASGRPQLAEQVNVFCWGSDTGTSSGALGDDAALADRSYPLKVGGTNRFEQLFGAVNTVGSTPSYCGLTADGTAYCWGNNQNVQLGHASCNPSCVSAPSPTYQTTPTVIPGGFKFSTLAMSNGFSCGIVRAGGNGTAGEVRCWGLNNNTRLGNSALTNNLYYGTPQAIAGTAAGRSFSKVYPASLNSTCALESGTGTAYCWGSNSNGQLGRGIMGSTYNPDVVSGGFAFTKLDMDGSTNPSTCGLTTAGKIICWGANDVGQLGRGAVGSGWGYSSSAPPVGPTASVTAGSPPTLTARVVAGAVVAIDVVTGGSGIVSNPGTTITAGSGGGSNATFNAFLNSAGNVVAARPSYTDPTPVEVSGSHTFTDLISTSSDQTGVTSFCGLKADGTAWCWGSNLYGAIGDGTVSSTGSGWNYTVAPTVVFSNKISSNTVTIAGSGAAGTANISGGAVTSITMTNAGSGYNDTDIAAAGLTAWPSITSSFPVYFNGGDGYGALPGTTYMGGGINTISIVNQGSGYTSAPTVTINPGTPLVSGMIPIVAATCTAGAPVGGKITSISCSSAGSGYSGYSSMLPTVTLSGGGGTGATASVTIKTDTVVGVGISANNNNRWQPTQVIGGQTFSAIRRNRTAMTALGTNGKLYGWGASNGTAYNIGNTTNATAITTTPTLFDAFTKNSVSTTTDTTSAGITFAGFCGLSCALDTNGNAYRWSANNGNGQSTNYSRPAAVCPTTPTTVPACSYRWSSIVAATAGSACGIKL